MKNKKLANLLRGRDLTIERLALQIGANRMSLTMVLLGRRRGKPTWNKLEGVLSKKEFEVAQEFARTAAAQRALKREGLYERQPTGDLNEATVAALRSFQEARDLPVTGELDERTLEALQPYDEHGSIVKEKQVTA